MKRRTCQAFRQNGVVAIPFCAGGCTDPIGNAVSCRGFAQHDSGPRRAADLAGRVTVLEAHAGFRQRIDVGGFVERASFNSQVAASQVVYEEEDYQAPKELLEELRGIEIDISNGLVELERML